jgi:hypothetical protein
MGTLVVSPYEIPYGKMTNGQRQRALHKAMEPTKVSETFA